jgi:YHS domain-containing protein
MKFSPIALTAVVAALASTAAFAGPVAKAKPGAKPAPKAVSLVCPVTGETIASAKDAAGSTSYKGKTYYFCCSGCKPEFDKDPAKFIKAASKPGGKPLGLNKM